MPESEIEEQIKKFLENGGKIAIVTSADNASAGLYKKKLTRRERIEQSKRQFRITSSNPNLVRKY